jgi:hypothetical protein
MKWPPGGAVVVARTDLVDDEGVVGLRLREGEPEKAEE